MRVVGVRRAPPFGLRGPTEAEVQASVEASRTHPGFRVKGVFRYRNHQEANEHMDELIADTMVRAQERFR